MSPSVTRYARGSAVYVSLSSTVVNGADAVSSPSYLLALDSSTPLKKYLAPSLVLERPLKPCF